MLQRPADIQHSLYWCTHKVLHAMALTTLRELPLTAGARARSWVPHCVMLWLVQGAPQLPGPLRVAPTHGRVRAPDVPSRGLQAHQQRVAPQRCARAYGATGCRECRRSHGSIGVSGPGAWLRWLRWRLGARCDVVPGGDVTVFVLSSCGMFCTVVGTVLCRTTTGEKRRLSLAPRT